MFFFLDQAISSDEFARFLRRLTLKRVRGAKKTVVSSAEIHDLDWLYNINNNNNANTDDPKDDTCKHKQKDNQIAKPRKTSPITPWKMDKPTDIFHSQSNLVVRSWSKANG